MKTLDLLKHVYSRLRSIPLKKWGVGSFRNSLGQCCLVGHVKYTLKLHGKTKSQFYNAACKATNYTSFVTVNDGGSIQYQQKTPKARSLAFLRSVIKHYEVAR